MTAASVMRKGPTKGGREASNQMPRDSDGGRRCAAKDAKRKTSELTVDGGHREGPPFAFVGLPYPPSFSANAFSVAIMRAFSARKGAHPPVP